MDIGQKVKDLNLINGVESENDSHSPILGYAYDGHPIYGPFVFINKTGGNIVQLESGYVDESTKKENRPPTSIFPPEFFVEDFTYKPSTNDTALDENNGRFCVTPEYPNGTYAYFATFDNTAASDGIFKLFKGLTTEPTDTTTAFGTDGSTRASLELGNIVMGDTGNNTITHTGGGATGLTRVS